MDLKLENHYPKWLQSPLSCLMSLMNALLITSGLIMALTFFCVVIVRYIFQADLFAYEEWLMMIAFWMFFIGSAVATHDKKHINADIVGFLITSPKALYYRALLVEIIELIILLTLVYWGFLMIQESIEAYPNWQETVALKLPFIIPRLAIFVGFLLMALYNALHLWLLLTRRESYFTTSASEK